jgi:hypothetical protein
MASRRLLVSAVTADALSTENIRTIPDDGLLRVVNMWASCVTLTDNVGLFLNNTEIMASGRCNVHAAALSLVNTDSDQLVFNTVVSAGDLRIPVPVLTTSLIFHLSVEPRI